MNSLGKRLTQAQQQLGLKKKALAEELRITPEWYSKIVNGAAEGSADIGLRLDDLLRRKGLEPGSIYHLKSGGLTGTLAEGPPVGLRVVASRIPETRTPSDRLDCEAYVQQLFEAAEKSENPNAWPVIFDRLKKKFPLNEWDKED